MTPEKAKATTKGAPESDAQGADLTEDITGKEALAIEKILPEAREYPELYKNVVKIIKTSNVSRCPSFNHCSLVRSFNGWVAAVSRETLPNLEFFLAVLAVSSAYPAVSNKTIFKQTVINRDLVAWARRQLRRRQTSTNASTAKSNTHVKKETERDSGLYEDRSKPVSRTVLPSIEQPSGRDAAPSSSRPVSDPDEFSYLLIPQKRKLSLDATNQESCERPKMVKTSNMSGQATIVLREASTQTEDDMVHEWAMDLASKLVGPGRRFFDDAMDQQTKMLMDFLPGAMKRVFQQTIATELAYQQSASNLQAQSVRPGATELSLRSTYQPYADPHPRSRIIDAADDRLEDLRALERRGDGHTLPAVMNSDFERLLGLGAFRLTRGHDQRRN